MAAGAGSEFAFAQNTYKIAHPTVIVLSWSKSEMTNTSNEN